MGKHMTTWAGPLLSLHMPLPACSDVEHHISCWHACGCQQEGCAAARAARAGKPHARVAGGCSASKNICLSRCPCAGDITIGAQNSTIQYGAQLVDYIRIRLTGVADNFNKRPQPVRRSPPHAAWPLRGSPPSLGSVPRGVLALHGSLAAPLPGGACSGTMSRPRHAQRWRASCPAP